MKRDPMETAAALLASSPIFQGAIPQELQAFLLRGGVPLHAFQRGETLCLPGAHNDCLGMLVEGSAQVSKGGSNRPVLMSTLQQGDLFGAVTLYGSRDYFITRVIATVRPADGAAPGNDCTERAQPADGTEIWLQPGDPADGIWPAGGDEYALSLTPPSGGTGTFDQ